jgi:hypothetical protein
MAKLGDYTDSYSGYSFAGLSDDEILAEVQKYIPHATMVSGRISVTEGGETFGIDLPQQSRNINGYLDATIKSLLGYIDHLKEKERIHG